MPIKRNVRTILLIIVAVVLGLSAVGSASAQQGSLRIVISQDGRFSEFYKLAQQAGLTSLLDQNGPFTVLAPTNEAIANLPAGTLTNQNLIRQTVLQHIVRGKYSSGQLGSAGKLKSALGQDLAFANASGAVTVNGGAKLLAKDIQASNGVIHQVDAVILPPWVKISGSSGSGGASSGSTTTGGGGGNALPPTPVSGSGPTVIQISEQVAVPGAKRLGVNIGRRDQYGAAQYIKNLIPNPGFESGEFGMIFVAWNNTTGNRVQADNWETAWNNNAIKIGHLPGFWNGAQYEVLLGAGKGRTGTVNRFTHDGGRYTFYLNGNGALQKGDIIAVRKEVAGYEGDLNAYNRAEPSDKRPGSPGRQALRLIPAPGGWQASLRIPMDSYGRDADQSAGKLIRVQGNWTMSVWAKGSAPGQKLRLKFFRVGENTFFEETVDLQPGWQQINRSFFVDPSKDPLGSRPNALFFEMYPIGGQVLVDDATLQRTDYNNPTVFSDPFVSRLRELRPGIIRNWGDQLGSSLDNQLATPFARQSSGHSPRQRVATNFHYSLHEFLQLAQYVGAEPWYVIPPHWTAGELQNLMAYLSAPAGSHPYANLRAALGQSTPWTNVFSQIHLEFGNEIWGTNGAGDPFLGATLRGGTNGGLVANQRIGIMKSSGYFNAGKFNFILGGQHRFPPRQQEFENNSKSHNAIGFAPYFGELRTYRNDAERYYPLFGHAWDTVRSGLMVQNQQILRQAGNNTSMAIYEINIHAITGNVPIAVRNDFLSGMGGGLALPLTMLTYQRDMQIRDQAAFQIAQYSFRMADRQYGRVWGLLRDVEATSRKRPTFLGMELANRAVMGNMLTTTQSGGNPIVNQNPINGITKQTTYPLVQSFAFKQGNQYSVVLFNLHLNAAQPVRVQLPRNPAGNATMHIMSSNSIHDNNENSELVRIRTQGINNFSNNYSLTLPKHSMTVITWTMN